MEKKTGDAAFGASCSNRRVNILLRGYAAPTQTSLFERNITKFILQPIKEEKPKCKEGYFSERMMIQNGTMHDFMKHQLKC